MFKMKISDDATTDGDIIREDLTSQSSRKEEPSVDSGVKTQLQRLTANLSPVQLFSLSAKIKKLRRQLRKIDYSKCSSLSELESALSEIPLCRELFSKTKLEEIVMFAEAVGDIEDLDEEDDVDSNGTASSSLSLEPGILIDKAAAKDVVANLKTVVSRDDMGEIADDISSMIDKL